jgi:hypothetical protein
MHQFYLLEAEHNRPSCRPQHYDETNLALLSQSTALENLPLAVSSAALAPMGLGAKLFVPQTQLSGGCC